MTDQGHNDTESNDTKSIVETKDIFIGCGFALIFGVAAVIFPEWAAPWFAFVGIGSLAWPIAKFAQGKLKSSYPKVEKRWFMWTACASLLVINFLVQRHSYWDSIDIESLAPNAAFPAEDVTVKGTGFTHDRPSLMTVRLVPQQSRTGGVDVTIRGADENALDIRMPRDVAEGIYKLEVTGPLSIPLWRNRSTATLEVLGAPQVDTVEPTSGIKPYGRPGTAVTIRGKNFDGRNGGRNNLVLFGKSPALAHECDSEMNCLTTSVPADATEGQTVAISVEAGGRQSRSTKEFRILGQPIVYGSSLEGKRGFRKTGSFKGSRIEVRGEGFYKEANVLVGGKEATIDEISEKQITFFMPADPEDGSVVVKTPVGRSAPVDQKIEIIGPPEITDFKPRIARVGDVVEVFGRNFDIDQKLNNTVEIGGAAARIIEAGEHDDQSILKIEVPETAVDGDVTVTTPAVRPGEAPARIRGFNLLPTITRLEPSVAFIGDEIVVHGHGLLPDVGAQTANEIPMTKLLSPPKPSGQLANFEVPPAAQSGKIKITQGPNAAATSPDSLVIERVDDLQKGDRQSNTVSLQTNMGSVVIRAECSKNALFVTGSFPGSPAYVGVGRCPVDVDVDRTNRLAYTANYDEHTISVVDVRDPTMLRVIKTIDTGGTDPTRLKVLRNGRLVVATKDGEILYGQDRLARAPISGDFVQMLGDPVEGGYAVVITSAGRDDAGTANVTSIGDDGFREIRLGQEPTAATQIENKIYVANHSSNNVSVIDMSSYKITKTIPFPPNANPFDLAQNPRGPEMYVTETGRHVVGIINTKADDLDAREIGVGSEPKALTFSQGGCNAVVFDSADHRLTRINPKLLQTYGKPQSIRSDLEVREIRIAADQQVVLVLSDGTQTSPFVMACPP